jgi:hypothetical protein
MDFAAERKNRFLPLEADQGSQSFVNDSLFRRQGCQFLRLSYQLVVKDNISSQ